MAGFPAFPTLKCGALSWRVGFKLKLHMLKWGETMKALIYILSITFLAWIAISWIDVLACQDLAGGAQSLFNFFVLISH